MREIPLTQGKVALVDDRDYDWLVRYKWHAVKINGSFYAATSEYMEGKTVRRYMHRFILKTETGIEVDHIDGDALNNLRSNLRQCTHKQNLRNTRIQDGFSSKYKGVGRKKHKWRARIMVDGKDVFLGYFRSEEQAASAYDNAAIKHFGEFARTNGY
jgi:hypothetical protein